MGGGQGALLCEGLGQLGAVFHPGVKNTKMAISAAVVID